MTPEEKKERKRLYDIEYRKKNAEKLAEKRKTYLEENKEKKKERDKKYCENNKDKKRQYDIEYRKKLGEKKVLADKQYYLNNKEKIKNRIKSYNSNNKEKINNYHKSRKQKDPLFKLKGNMRSLIKSSFIRKGLKKFTKTEIILGCSFEEFKEYIESKFESWMTWDNYGNPKDGIYELKKTWDIDHLIPLSTANSIEEVLKLNHYTNLQPLCSYINRFVKK